MNKLISANLLRLRHSKIFWLCLAFSAGMSLLLVLMNYHYQQDGLLVTLKDNLLTFLLTHGFLIAAFAASLLVPNIATAPFAINSLSVTAEFIFIWPI